MVTLPKLNDLGFFEIRLESIGGLGANLAGKMLAEAGVVGVGFNGVSFSSYGSEKKGSPVKAHIRFCDPDTKIRDTTPVERPHVVGIFHESLYKTVNVISGIYEDSIVLVNSRKITGTTERKAEAGRRNDRRRRRDGHRAGGEKPGQHGDAGRLVPTVCRSSTRKS